MALSLNTCETWIKWLFFQKLQKIAQWLGDSLPDPSLWYVWLTLLYSTRFPLFNFPFKFLLQQNSNQVPNQVTLSDISFCDIFARKRLLFQKVLMTSLHVISILGPPIKNPGYVYEWDNHIANIKLKQFLIVKITIYTLAHTLHKSETADGIEPKFMYE